MAQQTWTERFLALLRAQAAPRYYKLVEDGYLTGIGTGAGGTEISETAGSAAKERRRWQLARLQEICGTATPLPKWQEQRLPLERTGGGRLSWPPPEGPPASSPQGLASGPSACRQAEQQ